MSVRKLLLVIAAALTVAFAVACGGGGGEAKVTSQPSGGASSGGASTTAAARPPLTFLCSDAPAATQPDSSGFPMQIQDTSGRQVQLTAPPSRIVSLTAGHTEILYAIGAGGQVVAADKYSDCPAPAKALPHLDAFSPSVEAITALNPDLVIVFYDPGGLVDALTAAKVKVIMLKSPESVSGVFDQIDLLGRVTGHSNEAAALAKRMHDSIDAVTAALSGVTNGPRVFHEVDNTYYTVGPGSFVGDLYHMLKAQNIADATGQAYPQMTAEAIIQADPQVIILADEGAGESPQTVENRAGWSVISAVRDRRVFTIDPDIVSRPGPRLVDALQTLAHLLYPERFN